MMIRPDLNSTVETTNSIVPRQRAAPKGKSYEQLYTQYNEKRANNELHEALTKSRENLRGIRDVQEITEKNSECSHQRIAKLAIVTIVAVGLALTVLYGVNNLKS